MPAFPFQNTVFYAPIKAIITRIQLHTDTIFGDFNTVASIALLPALRDRSYGLPLKYQKPACLLRAHAALSSSVYQRECLPPSAFLRRATGRGLRSRRGASSFRQPPRQLHAFVAACALRLNTLCFFFCCLRACSTCYSSSSPHGLPLLSTRVAPGYNAVQVTPA